MDTPLDYTRKEGETREEFRARILGELKRRAKKYRRNISSGQIPVAMDVDDFGFLLPGHDDLLRLKKSFPNFKITAFTIPLPKEFYSAANAKHMQISKYREWAKIVNELDWLEVAVHGFSHVHNELEVSYDKAIELITAVENFFDQIGLKYAKIFKAPYWQYSYDALVALRDKGYIIAIDRNHPREVPDGAKRYIYNWSFEEPLPEMRQIPDKNLFQPIKGHGHFTGQNTNNIADALQNILRSLPSDAHFMTIGEYHEKYGND